MSPFPAREISRCRAAIAAELSCPLASLAAPVDSLKLHMKYDDAQPELMDSSDSRKVDRAINNDRLLS